MEAKGMVSVFTASLGSKEELDSFISDNFTSEGDVHSAILCDLQIDFLDKQFLEVLFLNREIADLDLRYFSYSENFHHRIDFEEIRGDSLILLYDINYSDVPHSPKK